MKSKILAISGIVGIVGLMAAGFAGAATSTPSSITTSFSGILSDVVEALITTVTTFFTNNLALIISIMVAVGLMWFLIYKAKSALTGN